MTTQILNLPKLTVAATVETDEDWLTSIAFVDASNNPIALTGIAFATEVRLTPTDATVWLSAGTATSDLAIASNVLSFNVLATRMIKIPPGAYVFDIVATADGHTRNVVSGALTIGQGITR